MLPKLRAYVVNGNKYLKCDSDKWTFITSNYGINKEVKVTDQVVVLRTTLDLVVASTGLLDKQGVEIFGDDIVEFKNPYDKRSKARGIIVWREDKACYGIDMEGTTEQFELYKITSENYLSVIGNKHQHPHLIEGVEAVV